MFQTNACSKRTTLCKWCATHVEMGNLAEHEDYCGSRTEKCDKCEEFIMLKNFEGHACQPPWEKKLAERSGELQVSGREPEGGMMERQLQLVSVPILS